MTITAIALSTILIYAVFCSGTSMIKSSQQMDYYAWGGYDVSYSVPTSDLFTYREKLKDDGIQNPARNRYDHEAEDANDSYGMHVYHPSFTDSRHHPGFAFRLSHDSRSLDN